MKVALVLLLTSIGAVSSQAMDSLTYVGVDKCKPCHKPEFETWSESAHAQATNAVKDTDGFEVGCLACHATGPDGALPGVQCEACHGPGSQYWPLAVMVHKEKAVAAGLILPGPEMCARCHDGQDHRRQVTWGAYKHDHREKKKAVELP